MAFRLWLVYLLVGAIIAKGNLIANPGMEGSGGNRLPAHWDTVVIGIAPAFATDDQVKHGGQSSVRISAGDITRAYVRSEAIEVAPGEKIRGSAWVKCEGVPVKPGHVILIGEFSQGDGSGRIVEKFDTANPAKSGWQKVSGEIAVPGNVTRMRMLLGFSYDKGTVWFDDCEVSTPLGLVARMEGLHGHLSPAMDEMPVTVMNRSGLRGAARLELILSPAPAEETPHVHAGLRGVTAPVTRPTEDKNGARPPRLNVASTRGVDEEDDDEVDPAKKPVASTQAIVRARAASTRPTVEKHAVEFVLNGEAKQVVKVPLQAEHRGEKELYLLLSRGGKIIFGAYQAVKVPPALVLEPPLPTHWVIEDGVPKFVGQVDLAMTNRLREEGRMRIDVTDGKGKGVGSWKSSGDLPDGVTGYSIVASTARVGEYKIVGTFFPAKGKPVQAQQAWGVIPRSGAMVVINAAGYPVYDGHAIFPLGVFNGSQWDALAAGEFTVSHAYNAVDVVASEMPDDLAAQKFLDESEKHGLKALFLIPRGFVFAGQWDAFRRRIRMFKNHPALLAWDEEEGMARGDLTPANFEKMIQILREEDPYHPIMVGDSRDTIDRVRGKMDFFPVAQMDMGMWWWYPFPLSSEAGSALQGDAGGRAGELVAPMFLTQPNTTKPIWVGVQSYRKNKKSPYQTAEEYRAQAYAAICAGAKGLMWYGGGVTGGFQSDPEAAHWKDLQGIVKEISERTDFWMEPASEKVAFEPSALAFSAIIKRHGNREILVAVNRSIQPVEITLFLPSLHGKAEVVGEKRSVSMENGALREKFEELGVHVYEFGR
jgi:hypothetical protein